MEEDGTATGPEKKVKVMVSVENGKLKADIEADQADNIKAIADALASTAPAIGGSSRGGKSRRNRKSKGGKSKKARKSLRRK